MDTDPRLPGEAEAARIYNAGARDEPPPALDRKILAAAHSAAGIPKPRGFFATRWAIPASAAAVLLLGLGVLLQLQDSGLLQPGDNAPPQASAPIEVSRLASKSPAAGEEPAADLAAAPAPSNHLSKSLPVSPRDTAQIADGAVAPPVAATVEAKAKRPETAETPMALTGAAVARERAREQPALTVLAEKTRSDNHLKQEADSMKIHADVVAVHASGQAGAYEFNVTLRSPDTGCRQYADWWEVVSEDGRLLYRRVLLHSHVDEQPFTRSGGPVPIQATTPVWVRAHMNTGGYGGRALHGSVQTGFVPATPKADFAAQLATQAPLPDGCDF
jgi:hypothetical protein